MNKHVFLEDFYYIITLVVPVGVFINYIFWLLDNINKLSVNNLSLIFLSVLFFFIFVHEMIKLSVIVKQNLQDYNEFSDISLYENAEFQNRLYVATIVFIFYSVSLSIVFLIVGNKNFDILSYFYWMVFSIVLSAALMYPYIFLKKENTITPLSSFDSSDSMLE